MKGCGDVTKEESNRKCRGSEHSEYLKEVHGKWKKGLLIRVLM